MRGQRKALGQVSTCRVERLVSTLLPEKTAGHVIDSAIAGNICRVTVSAVISAQFRGRECSVGHRVLPSVLNRSAERPTFADPPALDYDYLRYFETNGDVSPRRMK